MLVQEDKIITIRENSRTLRFTVPLDFDVTDEYIKNKMDNRKLTDCEEWLKHKGFIEESRGWSYYGDFYGDSKKTITIPSSFVNTETNDLYVKFHRIEGVKAVKTPFINIDKTSPNNSQFTTLNNFPDYIDSNAKVETWSMSQMESNFYIAKSKSGEMLQESKLEIDDHLLYYIAKNKFSVSFFDLNRFNAEVIKNYDKDLYNTLTSLKGIKKFNL